MMNITIAGNIGKDAESRRTQSGDMVTSFSVAVAGVGRDAPSTWFDCSMFGNRGETLAPMLRKGGFVSVAGRFGTRIHDGKTYLQINVNEVTLGPKRADASDTPRTKPAQPAQVSGSAAYDIDDEIPF